MENLKLMQLPVEQIHRAWNQIEPLLASLEQYCNGECTTEQSKVELIKGLSITLVSVDPSMKIVGVLVGSWNMTPGKRIFFVTAWAGANSLPDYLYAELENWVKANGGTAMHCGVRDSMGRMLKQRWRYEKVYTIYEKEIV
jgi:hypothetical protein